MGGARRRPGWPVAWLLTALVLAAAISTARADRGPVDDELASRRAEATAAYIEKRYPACATAFDRLAAASRLDSDAYSAACCHALAGATEAALSSLHGASRLGLRDLVQTERDPDLASVRADGRWPLAIAAVAANRERYLATVHRELAAMYEDDQADRTGAIDWSAVAPRDEARRARARQLIAGRALRVADDYYHAAMLFQHGATGDDYRQARTLARKAVALAPGHDKARWLAAAAHDRYLWAIGEPQVYGTQFHLVNGAWTVEPIDRVAVTDHERARRGVRPLADAERLAASMNARDAAARSAAPVPSVTRVARP